MKIEFTSQKVLDMLCEVITKRTGVPKSKLKISPETVPLTPGVIEVNQKDIEEAIRSAGLNQR